MMKNFIFFLVKIILFSNLLIGSVSLAQNSVSHFNQTFLENQGLLSSDCQNFISSIEKQFDYGWVQSEALNTTLYRASLLTEKLKQQNSKPLFIFYYYLKNKSQFKNPVLFLNGGPHYSSQMTFQHILNASQNFKLNSAIDFIFMDQRGTGCSSKAPVGDSPETISSLKSWGSVGIVHDAEQIRKTLLGPRKWKIFGQSYGAFVGYRYLELYPDNLEAAYLHGFAVGSSEFEMIHSRIQKQIENFLLFQKKYPDSAQQLRLLQAYLNDKNHCFKTTSSTICGHELTAEITQILGFSTAWEVLATAVKDFFQTQKVNELAIQKFVTDYRLENSFNYKYKFTSSSINSMTELLAHVVGAYDTDSNSLNSTLCQKILDQIGPKSEFIYNECLAPLQFNYVNKVPDYLAKIQPELTSSFLNIDTVKLNLESKKIKVFTYSGQNDSFVPVDLFQKQEMFFGSLIKQTLFLNSGHEGFYTEKKIFIDLAE